LPAISYAVRGTYISDAVTSSANSIGLRLAVTATTVVGIVTWQLPMHST